MAWGLGSWLCFVRSLQLLGTLVSGSLNGFLLAYIVTNRLGETRTMVCLEWIICVLLIYAALNLLVIHGGGRSNRTPWLVYVVVMDVVCCGADLAIITLLARAGLPSNCAGLTRTDFEPGDASNNTVPGYDTVRFSDEMASHRGMLDRFCGLERTFYYIALAIVFSYTATIVLAVLRICEGRYTSIKNFNRVMDSLHGGGGGGDAYELAHKVEENRRRAGGLGPRSPIAVASPSSSSSPVAVSSSQPLAASSSSGVSEGVLTTTATLSQQQPPPLPRRSSAVPDLNKPPNHHPVHVATTTTRQSVGVPGRIPNLSNTAASSSPSSPPSPPLPMGLGIATDHSQDHIAASAMITDGPRFGDGRYEPGGVPTLPPYSPRSPTTTGTGIAMSGHAEESNELRLSGYVKGETRAQTMKDSGGG